VIADLRLAEHGLRIVERRIANFLPLDDGRYLKVGEGRTHDEVAKFSARDAERGSMPSGAARSDRRCAARARAARRRRNVSKAIRSARSPNFKSGRIANRLRRLALELQRELLDLFTRSAGEMLDSWFESDLVKALFGFDAIVGNYASPYAAGSAYVMLHHASAR
jgi:phytoene dehydrogenase-like protein